MNPGRLLIGTVLLSGLFCSAQGTDPAGKPAANSASAPAAAPASSATAATAPGVPALAAGAAAGSYIIGPSDVLNVTVWKDTTLSGTMLVRPDGMISMPLLNDIQAAGLTPLQLADQIQTKLKDYMTDPLVTVVLSQIHSKVVYLLGEVGRKGPMDMTPGMTLLEAISSAGGLTDYANPNKIYILRTEPGRHLKISVRFKNALKGDSSANVTLKAGDTSVVP